MVKDTIRWFLYKLPYVKRDVERLEEEVYSGRTSENEALKSVSDSPVRTYLLKDSLGIRVSEGEDNAEISHLETVSKISQP